MAYSIKDYNPDDWKQVQATMLLEQFDNNEIIATPTAYKKKYKNLYDNNYTAILPGLNSMAGNLTNALTAANAAADLSNDARDKVNEVVAKVDKIAADVDKIMAFLEDKYNITFDEYYKKAL